MNRRNFIQNTTAVSMLGVPLTSYAGQNKVLNADREVPKGLFSVRAIIQPAFGAAGGTASGPNPQGPLAVFINRPNGIIIQAGRISWDVQKDVELGAAGVVLVQTGVPGSRPDDARLVGQDTQDRPEDRGIGPVRIMGVKSEGFLIWVKII